MRKNWLMVGLVLLVGITSAWAGDEWQKIGELTKGGKLPVNKQISACRLESVEGVAIVNTLVVFDGDNKRGIPVRAKLQKGETRDVPVGDKVKVTELGMSLETKGRLAVYVK
jgi:hypothetical protein